MSISLEQLRQVMPHASTAHLALYHPPLQHALAEADATTLQRAAAFVAQVAHETMELQFMSELWGPTPAQRRYEPPGDLAAKLGNTKVGDGHLYRGRSAFQVTGRANYERYGVLLGLDLINDPDLLLDPENGFRAAALYWLARKCNDPADLGDIDEVTHRVNGGYNGRAEREAYYQAGLVAFESTFA